MEILTNCPWKGNVRELANFIERAVILARGEALEVPIAELRPTLEMGVASSLTSSFRQAERSVIVEALKATAGRIAGKGGAAERLGLKRTTLQNKIAASASQKHITRTRETELSGVAVHEER
jgi:formate hydrogenlyase transcriptional activator